MSSEERKNYNDYMDRIIISDASALINLNHINKIYFLRELFSEIYTTNEVKNECHFELPIWIKIKDPRQTTLNLLDKKGIDKGEKTAIALAYEISIKYEDRLIENKPCLILDDGKAKKKYDKLKLGVESINTSDILGFAFDKKFFSKEEGFDYIKILEKNKCKCKFKEDTINKIFNINIKQEKKR